MIRESPIRGSWYKGNEKDLRQQILQLFENKQFGPGAVPTFPFKDLLGLIVPHAGYQYSGYTAAHSYKLLGNLKPDLEIAIILGPNHYGIGPEISISDASGWETPFGVVDIELDIVSKIREMDVLDLIAIESHAHVREHSIDIQVPFLKFLFPDIRIIPICLKSQSLSTSKYLADKLHTVLSEIEMDKIIIIASTDLSHEYVYSRLQRNDELIIEAIQSGNINEFHEARTTNDLSMCGYGSVYTLLAYSSLVDENCEVNILNYSNSARITGKKGGYTVGYLSAVVTRHE